MTPSIPENPEGHFFEDLSRVGAGLDPVCRFCGVRQSQAKPDVMCKDVVASYRPRNQPKHDYNPFE